MKKKLLLYHANIITNFCSIEILSILMAKKKTSLERVIEYLISEGAREIADEEQQTEWFKKEMESIESISCKYETEEEFLRYCK